MPPLKLDAEFHLKEGFHPLRYLGSEFRTGNVIRINRLRQSQRPNPWGSLMPV